MRDTGPRIIQENVTNDTCWLFYAILNILLQEEALGFLLTSHFSFGH
jgi:hypothetical protein